MTRSARITAVARRTAVLFVLLMTALSALVLSSAGTASASDYQVWRAHYGATAPTAADGADYLVWQRNVGG